MKILYLHIGAGKTGTSAIQSQLAINKDILWKHGVFYPSFRNESRAKNFKITSGNALDFAHILREDKVNTSEIKRSIKKYVNDAEGKNILLSSEAMHSYSDKNACILREQALKLGYQVKVIYYVRAIADHMMSSYHQSIKRHKNTKPFDSMIKNKTGRFLKTIERSGKNFGYENIILKNYDLVKDNIFLDFLTDVLKFSEVKEFTIKNKKVNRSLIDSEIDFMLHINRFFNKNNESIFISDALIHNNPDIEYQMSISKKHIDELSRFYATELEQINSYLPENQRPLKLVDSLKIVENEKLPELNQFQQSITAVLAEIVKEIKK